MRVPATPLYFAVLVLTGCGVDAAVASDASLRADGFVDARVTGDGNVGIDRAALDAAATGDLGTDVHLPDTREADSTRPVPTRDLDRGAPLRAPTSLWWNAWPRPHHSESVERATGSNSNFLWAPGLADEGRAPMWRVLSANAYRSERAALRNANVRTQAWLEGWGQSRAFIGKIAATDTPVTFAREDSVCEGFDECIAPARVYATHFSWTFPIDPDANRNVWISAQSYVNDEPWLGSFTRSACPTAACPGDPLPVPTFPDGREAIERGSPIGSPTPFGRLYDALASKDIFGQLAVGYGVTALASESSVEGLVRMPTRIRCSPELACPATFECSLGFCVSVDGYGDLSINKDPSAAWWNEYNRIPIEYGVQNGVDAFWIDNYTGWDGFGNEPVRTGFGEWTKTLFQRESGVAIIPHLRARACEWKPSACDSAEVDDDVWKDRRFVSDDTWLRFLAFKAREQRTRHTEQHANVAAAVSRAGREVDSVAVTGNDIPALTLGGISGNDLDVVSTEHSATFTFHMGSLGHGLPPYGRSGSFYDAAVEYGRGRHAFIWYYLDGENTPLVDRPNLGSMLAYEALGRNTLLLAGDDPGYSRVSGTTASTRTVHDVIEAFAPTFGARTRAGRVALVWSTATQLALLAPGGFVGGLDVPNDAANPDAPRYLDHELEFHGLSVALEDVHVPYRVVPDFRLDRDSLVGVSVLVLPNVHAIRESAIRDVIEPFVAEGGFVIVIGRTSGIRNGIEEGLASRGTPALADLARTAQSNGHGLLVDISLGGRAYALAARTASGDLSRAVARALLTNAIQSASTAGRYARELTLERDGAPFVNGGVNGFVVSSVHYDATTQRRLVDFVNLAIDVETDAVADAQPFDAVVAVPERLRGRPIVVTLRNAGARTTPVELMRVAAAPSDVRVRIPAVRMFATLEVRAQ